MRVIAGEKRGTKLYSLEGSCTRPTLDRVKQSLFSIIQYDIKGAVCLDLYAGSGALGIEAISRGASFVDFIDFNIKAIEIINKNLDKTNFSEKGLVINSKALDFVQTTEKEYNLILLDPPYGKDLIVYPLQILEDRGKINEDAIIVIEHPIEDDLKGINNISSFHLQKIKKYKNKCISIYRRKSERCSIPG
ncbi:MAG: 16S rRNA (guanine(966)-N(2))-methyltransferase RsmD [Clostridiales bacterium]|nr:MAG: 16S rRNA (guanine(966)-N(2))-methyltransferase RsmD [Clostridiales bacterium]